MKRIIFDLDNTLIKWKNEYVSALKKTMEEFNVPASVEEVNKLLKQFEDMKKMMKMLGNGNLKLPF